VQAATTPRSAGGDRPSPSFSTERFAALSLVSPSGPDRRRATACRHDSSDVSGSVASHGPARGRLVGTLVVPHRTADVVARFQTPRRRRRLAMAPRALGRPSSRRHPGAHADGAAHRRTRCSFRYFEPSLQSAFHPSISLLVRYRSRAHNQPYDGYTSRFKLQSQTVLLMGADGATGGGTARDVARGCNPLLRTIPGYLPAPHRHDSDPPVPGLALPFTRRRTAGPLTAPARPRTGPDVPVHSPLLRHSQLLSHPPPSDMLKSNR